MKDLQLRTDIFRTFAESKKERNINMATTVNEQARFDTRLPKKQKQFFERAAALGGYRNLTDFVIQAVQEKAKEIIKEQEQLLAWEEDCEIFFNEIANSRQPNKALRQAVDKYNSEFSE